MATEAPVAEQTTDGLLITDGKVEEKKVIDETKILGENVCQHKETGRIGKAEEPKVEQPVSPETAITDTKTTIEDEKDETHADEEVKKEDEGDKAPASEVLEDKKDHAALVGDVKAENEDIKVLVSEVSVNSEDDAVRNVKEKAETGNISSSEVPEVENSKPGEEEKTEDTAESLSKGVEKQVVEPEISSVQELELAGQVSEVAEPVIVAKATEELSNITADPALASETAEEKALAAIDPGSDATGELEEKIEIHETNIVLEALKDEKVLTNDVEIPCAFSKEETDMKESGNTSAYQALDVDAASEKNKAAHVDSCAGGCKEETKNEGSGLSGTESLTKELTVDPRLSKPSTVAGEAEPVDINLVTEATETAVKPEIKDEPQNEATLETEPVEEQKEEKIVEMEAAEKQKVEKTLETGSVEDQKGEDNVETEVVEEQKEEKTLGTSSALIAAGETGDLSYPPDEVAKSYIEEEKNSEGANKVAEEQRDFDGSDPATKTTEISSEKEKASEVAEQPKDQSVTENITLVHTSRGIDPEGQKGEVPASIKEPVDKPEKMEKIPMADVEKDKVEDKTDEAEEFDTQKLAESSKDGVSSKTDAEAQKSETPAKPKTLISKLKRSIVKVKKAIIGKSPSSKTISAESKDVSEVR